MRCDHCRGDIRGHATVDRYYVCHPDQGLDCYKLMTLYGHHISCLCCMDVRILLDSQQRLALSVKDWQNVNGLLGNDS